VIAKRYGVLPSEVAKIPVEDYQLNLLVVEKAFEEEAKAAKKIRPPMRGGRR
jgi:hypothetical protein